MDIPGLSYITSLRTCFAPSSTKIAWEHQLLSTNCDPVSFSGLGAYEARCWVNYAYKLINRYKRHGFRDGVSEHERTIITKTGQLLVHVAGAYGILPDHLTLHAVNWDYFDYSRTSDYFAYKGSWRIFNKVLVEVPRPRAKDDPSIHLNRPYQEVVLRFLASHPFVAPILGAVNVKGRLPLGIVSPSRKCEHIGTSRPPLQDLGSVITQLAQVVEHLHFMNIVHINLSPSGIIYDGDHITLTHFSFATLAGTILPSSFCSGAGYIAPELMGVVDDQGDALIAAATWNDIYSLASVYYFLLTGCAPFDEETPYLSIKRIHGGSLPSFPKHTPLPIDFPLNLLWTLMESCWQLDPTARPTATHILAELRKIFLPLT